MEIVVGEPSLRIEGTKAWYEVPVDGDRLWFNVQAEHRPLLSERSDAAALAMLYPAMLSARPLHVAGPLSERLYYNFSGPLQAALRSINPALKRIRVTADRLVRPLPAAGVAGGFSGGVDSFSMVKRHHLDHPTQGFRLTHLTLHDIWSGERFMDFDGPDVPTGMRRVMELAGRWGLPLVKVASNIGAYYRNVRFEDTHTLRNAAAAHVLSAGIGRFLYSSAYALDMITLRRVHDIARADPVILSMASSEAVDLHSGDCDFCRFEKTDRVTFVPESRDYLHVCAETWGDNCSSCWKCRRTLLTLEVLGKLDAYRRIFDVDRYLREKPLWLDEALRGEDPFILEIKAFATERGFRIRTGTEREESPPEHRTEQTLDL
jgi:hypothetical protein